MSDGSFGRWTLHPVTERDLAEERRKTVGDRRIAWLVGLAWLTLCPFTCLSLISTPLNIIVPIVGPLALTGLSGLLLNRTADARQRVRHRHASLRESYGVLGDWVVDLTVYQGSTPTGYDYGAVWFENDRLYFSGDRTSFSVAARQVEEFVVDEDRLSGLQSLLTLELKDTTPVGRLSLGFELIGPDSSPLDLSRHSPLLIAIDHWRLTDGEAADGGPPLTLGPQAPSVPHLVAGAVAVPAFWIGVPALIAAFWVSLSCVAAPLTAALLFILWQYPSLWTIRPRWAALRDRLKLDRQEGR